MLMRRLVSSTFLVAAFCVACDAREPAAGAETPAPAGDSGDAGIPEGPAHDPAVEGAGLSCASGKQGTTLTTDDGVDLLADLHASGEVGGAGVVLLHMIPPHWDYTSYPASFIDPLVERGFTVVNVNRRGAPGSGGVAEDAYKGPQGWLDAKAGRDLLVEGPCKVDAAKIAIVGASNGTTSMLDYGVAAAGDEGLASPSAYVFLSGGPYTESQNALDDARAAMGAAPAFFAYPKKEAEWNEGAKKLADDRAWQFHEFDPGDHGTKLFETDPAIVEQIVGFLGDAK